MVIAGGAYYELCSFPEWSGLFGSGGRAAASISGDTHIRLHTFAPELHEAAIRAALAPFENLDIFIYRSQAAYEFHYIHPLSSPIYYTDPPVLSAETCQFTVHDEVVLRFGFMEGDAIVHGNFVIYDPQSSVPQYFSANGSTAKHLAYVLNEGELFALFPGSEIDSAARMLIDAEDAELVLVKRGVFGVRIITREGSAATIPAYKTSKVFKVGSGDVFSAAFAYHWGHLRKDPFLAAKIASQSAAWYCDTRSLPIADQDILDALTPVPSGSPRQIYLAGSFFTVGQRLLIEETRNILLKLGANVFSPYHDIGLGEPSIVAPADTDAIKASGLILALTEDLDLGTSFEVGYGTAFRIDVLVHAFRLPRHQFSMVLGTGGSVEQDYATAMYKAVWASIG